MGAKSFREKIKKDYIQATIETNWERNTDEFLTFEERLWLENNSAMPQFVGSYFADLVSRYQGSCDSLSNKDQDFLDEFNLFDDLDNIQFECTACGWWYEVCEMGEDDNGEMNCDNCSPLEED